MRWILGLLLVAGCDDGNTGGDGADAGSAAPPAGDTYVAGLEKAGGEGQLSVRLMAATPAPPELGDNTWTLEVVDAAGEPRSGCTVTIAPRMPAHGHGTNRPTVVTEAEPGDYSATPLDLFMPGLWEIPVAVTCGAVEDRALFEFWIEG